MSATQKSGFLRSQVVKTMGVDPGLASTGVGMVESNGGRVSRYAFQVIRTSAKAPLPDRLDHIFSRMVDILVEEKPGIIAIEDVFFKPGSPKSGISLGKVIGVIMLAGRRCGAQVHEIPAREAKQVLTGNGNASKDQMEKAVRRLLGCAAAIRPDHASDAIAMALIGMYRCRQSELLRQSGRTASAETAILPAGRASGRAR